MNRAMNRQKITERRLGNGMITNQSISKARSVNWLQFVTRAFQGIEHNNGPRSEEEDTIAREATLLQYRVPITLNNELVANRRIPVEGN